MNKNYSVCVVIVTYGDRINFLSKVISKCIEEDKVKKIYIVDNNSSCNKFFFDRIKTNKIEWIKLNSNTGSANGYHVGIKYAYETSNCDLIWLLDDDNLPEENALNELLYEYNNKLLLNKNTIIALQSKRPNFLTQKELFKMKDYRKYFSHKNNFLGFSFVKLINKIFNILKPKEKYTNLNLHKELLVDYTEYGGLLLDRNTIERIGFPKTDFVLYSDDTEYTYRITKEKGLIYIINNSIVNDIDLSWNNESETKSFLPIMQDGNNFRVYYSTRNQFYFQKNFLVTNPYLFYFNGIVYILIILIYAFLTFKFKRLNVILLALKDGFLNNMGISGKFKLMEYHNDK